MLRNKPNALSPICGHSESGLKGKKYATPYLKVGCKEFQMVEAAGIEPASCDVFGGSRSVRSR